MSDERKHSFTAKIADAEPIRFEITLEEEEIYRKACYHVNMLWGKFRSQSSGSGASYNAMAKVALAFAELYYRKSDQLREQDEIMTRFEAELDQILNPENPDPSPEAAKN